MLQDVPKLGTGTCSELNSLFSTRLATKVGQTRACGQPRALTEHAMRFVRSGWLCHLRTQPWHGNGDAAECAVAHSASLPARIEGAGHLVWTGQQRRSYLQLAQ